MYRITLKSSLYYFDVMTFLLDHVFMGHFARDTIISPFGEISRSLGGGVTFGTLTARNFDINRKIGIFSEIGKDFDLNWLSIFNSKIDLAGICKNSEKSTNFEIEYFPQGGRQLTLKSQANPLEFSQIPLQYLSSKSFIILNM